MIFTPYAWPFSDLDYLLKVLREISPPPPPLLGWILPPGTAWLLAPPFSSQSCSSCPLPGLSVQAGPPLIWEYDFPLYPLANPWGPALLSLLLFSVGPTITLITLNAGICFCRSERWWLFPRAPLCAAGGKSPRQRAGANVGLGVFPFSCGVQCLRTAASYNLSIL